MPKTIPSTMSFGGPLTTYPYVIETMRRHVFNKPIDDSLFARMQLYAFTLSLLPEEVEKKLPRELFDMTLRRMVDPWTPNEMRELSKKLGTTARKKTVLQQEFLKRGIRIPQSAKEARQLLKADPRYRGRIE